MSSKLSTEILINLTGNLTAMSRKYGSNMSEFARTSARAMSVVKASTTAAGRGLDILGNRYTGMIAGFAGGAMLSKYKGLDRELTRMGITAGKTREQMSGILDLAQDVSFKVGVDTSDVLGAFKEINARSGDLDLAVKNTENIGNAIAASGATGESIGGLIADFLKLNIKTKEDTLQALDGLNRLGKEGAFELKDAAERLPASLSMYAAAGGKGVKGAMDVMTVAEVAMDVTANREKASTAVENFITDLQNPKVISALENNGIQVFDAKGKIRSLPSILQETAQRSAQSGAKKQAGYLDKAGFNQDSIRLIQGVSSEAGAAKLKTYVQIVADGKSILDDAAYASRDFTSATQRLTTATEKFTNTQLAGPVQELADALNSVDKETVENWMEIGKNIALVTGGVIAARKVFQVGKGAWDLFGGGKSKGIPTGVADVFGTGVMPVYVTNMPSSGLGNGSWFPEKSKYDKGGAIGMAINTVDELYALLPFPQNDEEREALFKRHRDSQQRRTRWDDVKDWFNSLDDTPVVDPRPWVSPQQFSQYPLVPPQLRGEIRVVVEGDARVKSVSSNQSGVTLSASAGKTNVGQN